MISEDGAAGVIVSVTAAGHRQGGRRRRAAGRVARI